MSQQSEIKEPAHFQIYELEIGLLAPSTHSFLSMDSTYIANVVVLMGSLTLKTTTLVNSLCLFCPLLAQHRIQAVASQKHSQMGSHYFPPAPLGSARLLAQPSTW